MSGSRTYRVFSNYSTDRRSSIVIDVNVSYRSSQRHLDNFEKTWRELGYEIERTRTKVKGTMSTGRIVEVYFEEEKDDQKR